MELYQMSRYENIADRLKRLSSPNAHNAAEMQNQTVKDKRNFHENRRENTDITRKSKYNQGALFSKYSTLEGDKEAELPTYSRIQDLLSPREAKNSQDFGRRTINSKINESKLQIDYLQEQSSRKNEIQRQDTKRVLGKVKSDGSIKIEQILESFNNYKQNKQKFLSALGKQLPSQQSEFVSEVELQEKTQRSRLDEQRPQTKGRLFLEIDNIWNEEKKDSAPIFERSFKRSEGVELIADVFSPTFAEPTERPKNFSRSKLILKNVVRQGETQNTDSSALKVMMSPRGPRVPGKICKNHDKTFTSTTKQRLLI